jgi:hypothetical protein
VASLERCANTYASPSDTRVIGFLGSRRTASSSICTARAGWPSRRYARACCTSCADRSGADRANLSGGDSPFAKGVPTDTPSSAQRWRARHAWAPVAERAAKRGVMDARSRNSRSLVSVSEDGQREPRVRAQETASLHRSSQWPSGSFRAYQADASDGNSWPGAVQISNGLTSTFADILYGFTGD